MDEQPDNRLPRRGRDDDNVDLPSIRRGRFWLIEVVIAGTTFGVMYLIDRLRPRRGRRESRARREVQGVVMEQSDRGNVRVSTDVSTPPGVHEAPQSIWPAVVALGVAFLFWGIPISWVFVLFGVVVMIAGIVGWASEMLDE